MKIKPGVSIFGIRPEMAAAIPIVESVYQELGADPQTRVITSGVEGKHKKGSLHFQGLALDFRIWGFPTKEKQAQFATEVRFALNGRPNAHWDNEYDVVLKKDHLHVEFQRKHADHGNT